MKEFIEKLIEMLEKEKKLAEIDRERWLHGNSTQFTYGKAVGYGIGMSNAIEIVNELAEEYKTTYMKELLKAKRICANECSPKCPFILDDEGKCFLEELQTKLENNGWIPCSKELPPQPEENPVFDNKPIELYLVSDSISDYPYRAFWNGKVFTDGFCKVDVTAWMPLQKKYIEKSVGSSTDEYLMAAVQMNELMAAVTGE